VSYDADLNKSIKTILNAVKDDKRIYQDPAPWAKVTTLGDSAVTIQLRVWTDAEDHRKVKMDISQPIKRALDKAGIEIPYEHCMIVKR
jgi:small conductance mechanosensitive channel